MPTPDSMKKLTELYDRADDLRSKAIVQYGVGETPWEELVFELVEHVKNIQLEVTNIGQRLDELERKVSNHADELSRLRNGSWA